MKIVIEIEHRKEPSTKAVYMNEIMLLYAEIEKLTTDHKEIVKAIFITGNII